jgi:Ig-like domain-containing protein
MKTFPLASGFFLLLCLFSLVSSASAAITFDSASSSAAMRDAKSIKWKHTLGSGLNRALVVAVAIDKRFILGGNIATVKFNNLVMRAAANSRAVSVGRRIPEIQIFYMTGYQLPLAAGDYEVSVSFTRKIDMAAGGAISLFGVQPGDPSAMASNRKPIGLERIMTSVNAPVGSWVVDAVASVGNAEPKPESGQIKRFRAAGNRFNVVGSAQATAGDGPATLAWNGPGRLVTSAMAFAARPDGAPDITTQPFSQTVVAGSNVTFTVMASGAPPLKYQWMKDGTYIEGANAATLSLANAQDVDAGVYTILITNAIESTVSYLATLNVTPLAIAPAITSHPIPQIAFVGSSVSFTVAATGDPAPTYQWRKNYAAIEGATTETLTITDVQLSDASFFYTVIVSNSAGSVESSPVSLIVFP